MKITLNSVIDTSRKTIEIQKEKINSETVISFIVSDNDMINPKEIPISVDFNQLMDCLNLLRIHS